MKRLFEVLRDGKLMVEVSLWGIFWSAAMTFSVGIFGDLAALVAISSLAVFVSYVWYRTGKRDVRRMQLARSRSRG